MFDIGWSEMMLVIIVMIIVIGPKDLPRVMRTIGNWVGQARAVARHFQDSLEQMAEESGIDDARKEIEKAARYDVRGEVERTIDPEGDLRESFSMESPEAKEKRARDEKAKETPKPDGGDGEQSGGDNPDRADEADGERKT